MLGHQHAWQAQEEKDIMGLLATPCVAYKRIYRAFQEGGPKAGLIFVVALVTVGGIRTLKMYGVT